MSKRLLGGIVATVLLSSVASPSARANAQTLESNQNDPLQVSVTQESLTPTSDKALQHPTWSATTARVNAYPLENRQAATVYVKNIPVLTYVGDAETADIVSGWLVEPATESNVTVANAVEMAIKLEQIASEPVEFTARWHEDNYLVMAGDQPLVTLGDSVQLPAATDNDAENVLQVTNRLRRLISDSEPVTEVIGRPAPPPPVQQVAAVRSSASGMASWYGPGFHGRTSASGEAFNQYAMTAAHRTLPFGTQVRVTNLNNGQQVVVRINDRGPYSHGRIIDLSAGAASVIGLQSAGVGPVQIEVLN
ncbi:septal ring lytic transglycosylase RlpA family protein [Leptothoe kymatousa]|uniref:Probable endolytic peptidoglycan transglycosylase RlpA n=1 Tax=Leptothoe kymatousa TAU-MAC 1615 TaxID=2364775 RepID=A0ABS5Y1K7_9CYAN|nr:septal ring lytic transglycosylase RlpA family protein [Leptothoe kymatousa]MBT9311703.1 septal ring lytic transglycosylase RlpA family protein [Leptothoe kymatousa TAU-MAC 1615]